MCTSALSKGDECSHLQSHNNFCCSTPKWLNFTSAATCNTQPHKMCCMHSSAATAMPDNWTSTIDQQRPNPMAQPATESTAQRSPASQKSKPHRHQQAQWGTATQGNGPPPYFYSKKHSNSKAQRARKAKAAQATASTVGDRETRQRPTTGHQSSKATARQAAAKAQPRSRRQARQPQQWQ